MEQSVPWWRMAGATTEAASPTNTAGMHMENMAGLGLSATDAVGRGITSLSVPRHADPEARVVRDRARVGACKKDAAKKEKEAKTTGAGSAIDSCKRIRIR
jgi:hypothetical protein